MALTIKNGIDPMYYAKLFGADLNLCQKAQALGMAFHLASELDTINLFDLNGTKTGSVKVKASAITLAKNNNIGPSSKNVLTQQFNVLLKEKIDLCIKQIPPSTSEDTAKAIEVFEKAKKNKINLGDIKGLDVSLLSPVKGVSPGSIYKVVAIFLGGLFISIRRTPSILSIRVEGNGLSTYTEPLKAIGFKEKEDYSSVHFQVPYGDVDMASRAVGAVIGAIGADKLVSAAALYKVEETV